MWQLDQWYGEGVANQWCLFLTMTCSILGRASLGCAKFKSLVVACCLSLCGADMCMHAYVCRHSVRPEAGRMRMSAAVRCAGVLLSGQLACNTGVKTWWER